MNTPRAFVVRRIPLPCLNCCDRHIGCHSECEKYLAYRDELRTEKKAITDRYKGERSAETYEIRQKCKNIKIKHESIRVRDRKRF